MKNKLLKMVVKYFNVKGFVKELVDDVLEEAVFTAVKKSKTTLDDKFAPMFYPLVETELLALIEEKLDMDKILKLEDEA
mgnify:CR=1 FL=1